MLKAIYAFFFPAVWDRVCTLLENKYFDNSEDYFVINSISSYDSYYLSLTVYIIPSKLI